MTFFGLNIDKSQEDWNSRRLRYLLKKYGSIKPAKLVSNGALHLPAGSLYSPAPNENPFAAENWVGLIETPDPSVSQVAVIPSPKFTAPDIEDGKSQGPSYLTTACIPFLQRRHGRTQSPLDETAEGPSAHVQQRDLRENSNAVESPERQLFLSDNLAPSDAFLASTSIFRSESFTTPVGVEQ
ncbi:unnamed protein product [Dibothriocephalus latus]|uniref:Uncharacterized protein n=1 Tax=Dibothriocephalus latus TaxID=60516 RepID=A0A3P7L8D0_DIBLA|nr:unnamed protein product [Dibothriocephalus latus]